MHFSTILPAFAAVAVATKAKTPAPKGTYMVAKYDDINVVPALPLLNNLETYQGLTYTGFATNQALDLTGVKTQSPKNNIVSGVQQTAITGAEAGWKIAEDSAYFDLKSLFYGCSVNTAEGAAGVAQPCTINVRGFRKVSDTNPVASQQFSYTPKLLELGAPPQKATFDKKFGGIQRVEVVQIESRSGNALNVVVLDNVAYNLYKKTASKGYGY